MPRSWCDENTVSSTSCVLFSSRQDFYRRHRRPLVPGSPCWAGGGDRRNVCCHGRIKGILQSGDDAMLTSRWSLVASRTKRFEACIWCRVWTPLACCLIFICFLNTCVRTSTLPCEDSMTWYVFAWRCAAYPHGVSRRKARWTDWYDRTTDYRNNILDIIDIIVLHTIIMLHWHADLTSTEWLWVNHVWPMHKPRQDVGMKFKKKRKILRSARWCFFFVMQYGW